MKTSAVLPVIPRSYGSRYTSNKSLTASDYPRLLGTTSKLEAWSELNILRLHEEQESNFSSISAKRLVNAIMPEPLALATDKPHIIEPELRFSDVK